uniref:t-SNARE coiled-coil homology domain-containing protein n=1 Tax=Rhabditophanes sp. KR3021 TaxID=114890 RepID=A0AC35TI85_9BILA
MAIYTHSSSSTIGYKNLSDVFFLLRSNAKSRILGREDYAVSYSDERVELFKDTDFELGDYDESPPPDWVNMIDEIQYELTRIKTRIEGCKDLQKHSIGNKSLFKDDATSIHNQDKIKASADEISSLFSHSNKLIALLEKSSDKDTDTTLLLRKHVVAALSETLTDLICAFKKNQQVYLNQIHNKSNNISNFFLEASNGMASHSDLDFFTDQDNQQLNIQQIQELKENDTMTKEREKAILNVTKNIYELNTIFKDLAELVLNQGTILDRIDYNVENASIHVKSGLDQLRKASNYQKKNQKMKIIVILAIIVIVLLLLIIFTKT